MLYLHVYIHNDIYLNDPGRSKRRLYGSIRCKIGCFSVRIALYYRAQNYGPYCIRIVNGPYCIRIVNGPYSAVFLYFTDQIRWAVLQRIVTVNRRKYNVLYPFTIFFSIVLLPRIRIPLDIPFHAIGSDGILQDIHSCSRYYCSMNTSLITFWLFNRWYIRIYLLI